MCFVIELYLRNNKMKLSYGPFFSTACLTDLAQV